MKKSLILLCALFLTGCSRDIALETELETANYCQTAADCTLIGSKCPFGCYIYVNQAEADRLQGKLDAYESDCVYSCIQSFGVDCVENKCEPILDQPPTEEEIQGNVGASCTSDDECNTPMSYLTRSSCPFTSMCIEGSCEVVCPQWSEEPNPDESGPIACEKDGDCSCDDFPGGSGGTCGCVNDVCVSVMPRDDL